MKKLLSLITLFALGAFSALTSWGETITLTQEILDDILANPGNYANDGNKYTTATTITSGFLSLRGGTSSYQSKVSVKADGTIYIEAGNKTVNVPKIVGNIPGGTRIECTRALEFSTGLTVYGGTDTQTDIKCKGLYVGSSSARTGTLTLDGGDGAGIAFSTSGTSTSGAHNKVFGNVVLKGEVRLSVEHPAGSNYLVYKSGSP